MEGNFWKGGIDLEMADLPGCRTKATFFPVEAHGGGGDCTKNYGLEHGEGRRFGTVPICPILLAHKGFCRFTLEIS